MEVECKCGVREGRASVTSLSPSSSSLRDHEEQPQHPTRRLPEHGRALHQYAHLSLAHANA